MAGRNYYSYQGRAGHRSPAGQDGLFGWTVFIFLLIGFVFLCWMGSYYIFAHPEKASNYRLLLRLHKIDPPVRFEITGAPRGEFLKPGQLLERFGSMTSSEIRRANETLLRNFLRNYHQNRDLVPYAVGTYRVIGTLPLSAKSFCSPGLIGLLQAAEQPEILLEQPFTCDEKNLPMLTRALTPNQEIKLEKPLDLSAVIHIERLEGNRLLLTTMPLLYGSYGSVKGGTSFSLEPPEAINLDAGLPVLSVESISQISGGKLGKGSKPSLGLRLSRIAEEEAAITETPVAKPRVPPATNPPKALAAGTPPSVARALPVNVQPVLPAEPAMPVAQPALPATAAVPVAQAIPVATPNPATLSSTPPSTLPPAVPASLPVAKPLPQTIPQATPLAMATHPVPAPAPALPAATPVPVPGMTNTASITNQPTMADPSQVWPVYAPGQMPRGRLIDSTESQDLASRGLGGERHYLKGRFTVTAAGNGRAVLRPQGAIAGVPVGPSSKVRIIVEFPAGTVPPAEGGSITRDTMRPFQITSIKRSDDGQINIYAREVTRAQ